MAAGSRRKRIGGHELVEQLNAVVAQLIKENRKLKRQVEKLTARGTKAASGTVDRSLRAIQKRAQKALGAPVKRRKRRVASAAAKKTTRRPRAPKTPA
jgi:cell division septum initiation protein DivIVA